MKTVLRTEQDRNRLREIVERMPLDPPREVEIRIAKDARSIQQHRLYWVWNTHIAGETGHSKDEIHEMNKERFLVRIYERDDSGFAAMIEAVREVYRRGMKVQGQALKKEILRLTSTATANKEQFTEFLSDMERYYMDQGIYLPRPEDVYREAMAA